MLSFRANTKHNYQFKGQFFERLALLLLLLKGYRCIGKNVRGKGGEIDLLFCKKHVLVLVEVKYRSSREKAHYAIHPKQKTRLLKSATSFLSSYPQHDIRLDVVLFYPKWPFVEHIKQAWDKTGL